MAGGDTIIPPHAFVEKIDINDIQRKEILGKGSFGVVYKARWKGIDVAVKSIETEAEKKAFAVEVKQLSRVSHPNIVKLYGACENPVCLVMEYAEEGSLYNVLHSAPYKKYTAGHAMNWALQCAKGVAYLHGMTPSLIHRDLKSPNLLLVHGGRVLKICDFGTACDKKTYMTNNKGSAAWMAPEVFEGSKYTEKCDIYSWGIILWELIARERPFKGDRSTAYSIMWSVHKGLRPPVIRGCPRPIHVLYTRCWDKEPKIRPSMEEVVSVMDKLMPYFGGFDEPIKSDDESMPEPDDCTDCTDEEEEEIPESYVESLRKPTNGIKYASTLPDPKLCSSLSVQVDEEPPKWEEANGLTLSIVTSNKENNEKMDHPNEALNAYQRLNYDSDYSKLPPSIPRTKSKGSTHNNELDNIYLMLEPNLQPIPPDPNIKQSVEIFEEHKQLAQEYLRVQTDMAFLSTKLNKLSERLTLSEENEEEEIRKMESEKKSLVDLRKSLQHQLEVIRSQRSSGRECHPHHHAHPT
uniref:Mitogen-activated protein kinase kinase kinase 7 n=1 Tax=Triatoma dimidiata TaxID=72491 RepID=A0A0V0GA85_TRIDM